MDNGTGTNIGYEEPEKNKGRARNSRRGNSNDAFDCTNLLAQFAPAQRQSLELLGTIKTIHKNDYIGCLDCRNDNVYFLLDGRVKIYQLAPTGKEVLLWFCSPGELFGFVETGAVSMVGGLQLNAQACTYGKLLTVKRQVFRQFLVSHSSIKLPIIRLLELRLCDIIETLSDLSSADVTSRVIKLLLKLGRDHGKNVTRGLLLDIPLTHQEMADMIGTSRQTVTTVLGDLKRRGLIGMERRSVVIRDNVWLQRDLYPGVVKSNRRPVIKRRYVNTDG